MSEEMKRFDPAAWHENGVVFAAKEAKRPAAKLRTSTTLLAAAASFAVLSSTLAVQPDRMMLEVRSASASAPVEIVPTDAVDDLQTSLGNSDYADPGEAERVVAMLGRLKYDERPDHDDTSDPWI